MITFSIPTLLNLAAKVAIIVVVALLFVTVIIFLIFFLHRASFKTNISNMKKTYEEKNNLLKTDCQNMIKRLSSLSSFSSDFKDTYNNRNSQFHYISIELSEEAKKEISKLDSFLRGKNYKAFKVQKENTKNVLNKFTSKVDELLSSLYDDLKEDEENRNIIIPIKSKYRDIKEFYLSNKDSLKPISKSFDDYFSDLEDLFFKYDSYLEKGDYKDCSSLIPLIEEKINMLSDVIEKLPHLETLLSTIIPSKCEEIKSRYLKMKEEGFILNHINIPQRLDKIKDDLIILSSSLSKFNIEGVEECLNSHQKDLSSISLSLSEEEEAKDKYLKEKDKLFNDSYEAEKYYIQVFNQIPETLKTYRLSQDEIDKLEKKKNVFELACQTHRQLENLESITITVTYTQIVKEMKRLEASTEEISQATKVFVNYINSLQSHAQEIYDELGNYYCQLKEAEEKVKYKINHQVYLEQTIPSLEQLVKTISMIDAYLKSKPIDLDKIDSIFSSFKVNCENIITEINIKEKECYEAEELIKEANCYRIEFQDCRKYLNDAEKYFNEGNFTKSIENSKIVLKLFATNNQT